MEMPLKNEISSRLSKGRRLLVLFWQSGVHFPGEQKNSLSEDKLFLVLQRRFELRTPCLKGRCSAD